MQEMFIDNWGFPWHIVGASIIMLFLMTWLGLSRWRLRNYDYKRISTYITLAFAIAWEFVEPLWDKTYAGAVDSIGDVIGAIIAIVLIVLAANIGERYYLRK